MRQFFQSNAETILVWMEDSSTPGSGKTGLTLTITASKAGGAFASISPTVTERGDGWYAISLTASHLDTLGDIGLHITATGAYTAPILGRVTLLPLFVVVPTANDNADALLKRDWTAVTGEASRSVLNALRFLRNKWSASSNVLTVTKEDDSTSAWTATLSSADSGKITGVDPA